MWNLVRISQYCLTRCNRRSATYSTIILHIISRLNISHISFHTIYIFIISRGRWIKNTINQTSCPVRNRSTMWFWLLNEFEMYYSWNIPSIGVVQRSIKGVHGIQYHPWACACSNKKFILFYSQSNNWIEH